MANKSFIFKDKKAFKQTEKKHNFLNSWYLVLSNKLVAIHTYYRLTDIKTDIHMDGHTDISTEPYCVV